MAAIVAHFLEGDVDWARVINFPIEQFNTRGETATLFETWFGWPPLLRRDRRSKSSSVWAGYVKHLSAGRKRSRHDRNYAVHIKARIKATC